MGRIRARSVVWVVAVIAVANARTASSQPRDRDRPIRVGNSNVVFGGGGYTGHDHPTFQSNGFINLAYQRRILRREVRVVPVWVRGAVNFTSEERDLKDTYTYWNNPSEGELAGVEDVQERTSDFTVRLELLADLLHTRTAALYGGGGLAIHTVSFRSRGLSSGTNGAAGLEKTENAMAPSLVVGGRIFMATQPWSLYTEARFGSTYGRAEGPQDVPPPAQAAPSVNAFDLKSVANFSVEGGIALHW